MNMKNIWTVTLPLLVLLGACGKAPKPHFTSDTTETGSVENAGTVDEKSAASGTTMLTCSASAKSYQGFGNTNLIVGRATEIPMEGDRFRVKPYAALNGEFTRVLGKAPASLAANAASYVVAPDRWYVDTQASAVTLFTSYRIAYEGALTLAGSDTRYAAAPTEESATANCTTFARQAWNRIPTAGDVSACKKVALVDTASETDVKARWAYALASVMASAGFLSY